MIGISIGTEAGRVDQTPTDAKSMAEKSGERKRAPGEIVETESAGLLTLFSSFPTPRFNQLHSFKTNSARVSKAPLHITTAANSTVVVAIACPAVTVDVSRCEEGQTALCSFEICITLRLLTRRW